MIQNKTENRHMPKPVFVILGRIVYIRCALGLLRAPVSCGGGLCKNAECIDILFRVESPGVEVFGHLSEELQQYMAGSLCEMIPSIEMK